MERLKLKSVAQLKTVKQQSPIETKKTNRNIISKWKDVVQKGCQEHNLNKEDAMVRGRWKKLIKIVSNLLKLCKENENYLKSKLKLRKK